MAKYIFFQRIEYPFKSLNTTFTLISIISKETIFLASQMPPPTVINFFSLGATANLHQRKLMELQNVADLEIPVYCMPSIIEPTVNYSAF